MHIRLDRADRTFHDQLYADGGREMKDHIALINQLSSHWLVVNVFDCVVKTRVVFEVANVLDAAGG